MFCVPDPVNEVPPARQNLTNLAAIDEVQELEHTRIKAKTNKISDKRAPSGA